MLKPRLQKKLLAVLVLSCVTGVQGGTTGQLNISVIVLPVMKIVEDVHTLNVASGTSGKRAVSATQRLVVFSNIGSGFCVTLEQKSAQVGKWSVDLIPTTDGVDLISTASGGYLLCAKSIGRKTIELQHNFALKAGTSVLDVFTWPVFSIIASP